MPHVVQPVAAVALTVILTFRVAVRGLNWWAPTATRDKGEDRMWTRRIARNRNPLRRTADRIEAWMTFGVVMTILLSAPLAGWSAGREIYRDDRRANAWEWQHWMRVSAVLLQDVSATTDQAGEGQPSPALALAPARWPGPGGTARTGMIVAGAARQVGDTVPIWVDDQGNVAGRPGQRSPVLDAIMTAILAAGAVAAGLAGLRRIVIWGLDHRRLRSWQAEWLVVEPQWSHR
jgi:hypothetical protein